MGDMAPLDPCPYSKFGQHDLSVVTPESDEGDLTFFCDRCGIIRRLPVKGAITRTLDDLSAEDIAAVFRKE